MIFSSLHIRSGEKYFSCFHFDIFNSGTTWVSFICHTLRTRGHYDFEEIVQVIPWTICAFDCGQDLLAEQMAEPRLYKSHEDYHKIPKNGRYIYVARDPHDVCISFYYFLLSWCNMNPNDICIDEFVDKLFSKKGSNSGLIWSHFLSFYDQRHNPNILFLFYEDLMDNLERNIEIIANFMNISLDDELREIALRHASFEFMKSHESKFDEHIVWKACAGRMGIDNDDNFVVSKVNKAYTQVAHIAHVVQEEEEGGRKDTGASSNTNVNVGSVDKETRDCSQQAQPEPKKMRHLSDDIISKLSQQWKDVIEAQTGVKNYQEFRELLSLCKEGKV